MKIRMIKPSFLFFSFLLNTIHRNQSKHTHVVEQFAPGGRQEYRRRAHSCRRKSMQENGCALLGSLQAEAAWRIPAAEPQRTARRGAPAPTYRSGGAKPRRKEEAPMLSWQIRWEEEVPARRGSSGADQAEPVGRKSPAHAGRSLTKKLRRERDRNGKERQRVAQMLGSFQALVVYGYFPQSRRGCGLRAIWIRQDSSRRLPTTFFSRGPAVLAFLGSVLHYMRTRKREEVTGEVEDLQKKTRADQKKTGWEARQGWGGGEARSSAGCS
ncbi:hypothetical protein ABZP36_028447 [Zizania latifolia]